MGEEARWLRCTPGEGLGNTFLLARAGDLARAGLAPAECARRACARSFDGLLVLGPRREGAVEARILNRDGSDGGVCLNGLRVAAVREGAEAGAFRMAGRLLPWRRVPEGIELHLRRADLPEQLELARVPLPVGAGLAVPFWNPHCVIPVRDLELLDLGALAEAAAARRDLFPEGVNVEAVAEGGQGRVLARVWERGVGETRACGSGAVAIALVAWAGGAPGPLEVILRGGTLALEPAADGGILLRGAASVGRPLELDLGA